jgi:hypothetical protein
MIGQTDTLMEFDEPYEGLGVLEVLESPVKYKGYRIIDTAFNSADSSYLVSILNTPDTLGVYNRYLVDSSYNADINEAVLNIIYVEKKSYQILKVGSSYEVVTIKRNPNIYIYENDTIEMMRGCCYSDFGIVYKETCWMYKKNADPKDYEGCIPTRIEYFELIKVKTLPNKK